MKHPALALAMLTLFLWGCPAFWVERGPVVTPLRSLERPALADLPEPDSYLDRLSDWRREVRVGLGGQVEAILWDARLGAAGVAHEVAINHLTPAAARDLLVQRWQTLYGPQQDRWAIDLNWRFDEQFVSSRRVLEPTGWTFRLHTSQGIELAPMRVSVLRLEQAPVDGHWTGSVRLWFSWLDPRRDPVVRGDTTWLRLELRHRTGHAEITWRFPGAW